MGYLSTDLSFKTLRSANRQRLPEFRNAQGKLAHLDPKGRDWSYNDWMVAVAGETGELANNLKKLRRGDFKLDDPGVRDKIAGEIADVLIYLDILAFQFDFDLGSIVVETFNRKSEKVGSRVYIGNDNDWHLRAKE